jgi:hypothetical protein
MRPAAGGDVAIVKAERVRVRVADRDTDGFSHDDAIGVVHADRTADVR